MYQLEERILFDGAAVAAVAVANQHHNDANKNDAAKNDAAHHNQNQDQSQQAQQHNPHTQSNSDITRPNSDGVTQQHTGVDNLLAQALGLDHSAPVTHNTGAAEKHVNVMVISTSLDNADAVASLADSNTIVVKYDSHNTTSAQLLAQINDSLHGRKADSIAFLSEAGNGQLSLFKDGKTTVTSLSDSVQQQFWHGVEGMLDSHGRVDFLASNLASTDAGKALVSEIAHITGHETAASTDLTGNAAQGGDWNLEFTAGAKDARQVDLVQTYLNRNILDSFTSVIPADTIQHEVAFINSSVMSSQEIVDAIKSLGENVDIVMLGKGDAFAQITQYLQDKSNIDAIHIISHGNDGFFRLGDVTVDSAFVQTHQAELAVWGKSLTAKGDILLYGCDIAADADGKAFVQQLAHATGADIAASTDDTGAAGNWTLEYHTGNIEASGFVFADYKYNLTNITVNNMTDNPIQSLPDATYTLRKAILTAQDGDEVIFAGWQSTLKATLPTGGADYTINLNASLGQIEISKNITIDGTISDLPPGTTPPTTRVIVDARPLVGGVIGTAMNRAFYISAVSDATHVVTMQNMIVEQGHAIDTGSLDRSNGAGGGIFVDSNSDLVLSKVDVVNNAADLNGGGIYTAGILTVQGNSLIGQNSADSGGGIFKGPTGTLTVTGSTVNGNIATGNGGGIYSIGDVLVSTSTLSNNTSTAGIGGGLAIESGSDTYLNSVTFDSNSATSGGGISYTQGTNLSLEFNTFKDNTASGGSGGGIYFADNSGDLTVKTDINNTHNHSTVFDTNTATKNGGGIFVSNSGNATVDFILFDSNSAAKGGAMYFETSGTVTLNEINALNNSSTVAGGAFYSDGSNSTTITNSYFGSDPAVANSGNKSDLGAAIYQLAGSLTINNSTFYSNIATTAGGAIYLDHGSLDIAFSTFANNDTAAGGQGADIYINNPVYTSDLSVVDSIFYNSVAVPMVAGSQIWLSGNQNVNNFTYNIYSDWYVDSANNPGNSLSAGDVGGAGNQVGVDAATSLAIKNSLYLANPNINANYRTYTMAIEYEGSIAYLAGTDVAGITHDQRGNTRTGTDVNGNTNIAPSVGAFEPIFYITVNSKADQSGLQTTEAAGHQFDIAKANGLTLREAIYWMDTYNRQQAFADGQYNNNHYVKFDGSVFADNTNNTIKLNYGAITVGDVILGYQTSKEIAVSSVAVINPLDPNAYGDVNDPVAYRAQNATGRIIVDAQNASAVFAFSNLATVYLSNLTATNGNNRGDTAISTVFTNTAFGGKGGGLHNEGFLILNNFVVSNSKADNNRSDLIYTNTGYGGGIYNSGVMQAYDTTVTGNSVTAYGSSTNKPDAAGLGGGIYNAGSFTIERAAIYSNSASGEITNVVSQSVAGGGIYNAGNLYVANTTIALNTLTATQAKNDANVAGAGAAIYNRSGNIYLYYSTITGNHTELNTSYVSPLPYSKSAVSVDGGTLFISDSIVAGNTVQSKGSPAVQTLMDVYVQNSGIVDTTGTNAQYNIIGGFDKAVYDWSTSTTNITGDSFGYVLNLNLDTAMHYNGAKTMNYRLQDGSVAIASGVALSNFGQFTSLNTDQRSLARPLTNPNMGSYESLLAVVVTENTDSGTEPVDGGFNFSNNTPGWVGNVTMRDAVYWADSNAKITVDDTGWTSSTVNLQIKAINILHAVDIDGFLTNLNTSITLDGGGSSRIFTIDNPAYLALVQVSLSNMTLQNGKAALAVNSGHGGAIYSKENLTLTNVSVLNSIAAGKGGGIFSQAGSLTISSNAHGYSNISGNTAATGGGGIYVETGSLSIADSSILSNTATTGDGGGLYAISAPGTITNTTFGYNQATTGNGGAIYINSSDLTMSNSTISQNTAGQNGGGLALFGGGVFDFTYITVANNIAGTALGVQKYGGGMYVAAGNMTIIDSIIAQNFIQETASTTSYGDFYSVGGTMNSATYSAVGAFFGFDFGGSATNIVGDLNGVIQDLKLSTVLEHNGPSANSPMTLYLAQTSVAASAGTTVAITTSENGKDRKATPSMGAFESRNDQYEYQGGDITDVNSWLAINGAPVLTTFDTQDATFIFDNTASGTLSTAWNVNSRSNIQVSETDGSHNFTIDSSGTIVSTRTGEKVGIDVLNSGILTLGTNALTQITLNTVADTSTIQYTLAGDQTILAVATYGNLVLSGGGTKQSDTSLTVNGYLMLDNNATLNINGGLTVVNGGIGTSGTIRLTGDLSLSGAGDFSGVALDFVGTTAAQNVFFDFDQTFTTITIDNVHGVTMDPLSTSPINATDFTFVNGSFMIHDSNLVLTNAPTGASGIAGRYFITAGNGTVSLPLSAGGTDFVLAVEDTANPGTYKWTNVHLTPDNISGTVTAADRAVVRLIDTVIHPVGDITDFSGSMQVTWNITPTASGSSPAGFSFTLVDYSGNAAGKYFDNNMGILHYSSDPSVNPWVALPGWTESNPGYFYVGHAFGLVTDNSDDPLDTGSLRWAVNQANLSGSGVIVFDETSPNFTLGANVVLTNGTLVLHDGVKVNIVGLTNGLKTYISADGITVMQAGDNPHTGTLSEVKLSYLDLRGNSDYVLINNAIMQVTNVSVTEYQTGALSPNYTPILNNNSLTVRSGSTNSGYLELDGAAKGNDFIYVHDPGATVTLRYTGGTNPVTSPGAEFSSTLYDVELVNGATVDITTAGRTIGHMLSVDGTSHLTISTDLTVNGDVAAAGTVDLGAGNTLTLKGAGNTLGVFSAGAGSTVNYVSDAAQSVDAVTYSNLTISGAGERTATAGFLVTENLAVAAGSQLTLNYAAASDTLRVNGSADVQGALAFNSLGTLALYGNTNNFGSFIYGTSTVKYLGGSGQDIAVVDYYNLEVGGAVVKPVVSGDFTVNNNFVIDAGTTFRLAANNLLVKGNFTATGSFMFTGNGTLSLEGNVTAAFNLTDGTVIYQGAAAQSLAGGTYYNLTIANGDKVLGSAVTTNGTFNFDSTAGRLLISTHDITLNGSLTGASGANGSYFANTTTVNSGAVNFLLGAGEVRTIVIGTLANWSELSFTGGSSGQTMSIWNENGIVPAIADTAHAVNMTFHVTALSGNRYSMDILDSTAAGASFDFSLEVPYYYDTTATPNAWVRVSNPLNQSGAFYFAVGIPSEGLFVTNNNDTGIGSLRWAIAAANLNPGIDTIHFSQSFFDGFNSRTINLLNTGLTITDSVIIEGPGSLAVTVNGSQLNNTSVFIINSASAIYVKIDGMTIDNGNAGLKNVQGIYNNELLVLNDVVITGASALNGGGIFNDAAGKIYMDRVTISDNMASLDGGGIYNIGAIQMTNTTITGNTAVNGGGIYNGVFTMPDLSIAAGTVMAESTTIDHNSAVFGGGVYTASNFYGYNLTVAYNSNSNSFSGGIYITQDDVTVDPYVKLENSTVAYNQYYGIYNSCTTDDIINTIVSYNRNGNSGPYTNISGSVSRTNSIVGSEGSPIFANGTLQDNGGWVQTIALASNSIAIDRGLNNGPSLYDARGYMRNGTRDRGAYEYNAFVAVNQNTLIGYSTVQAALNGAANGQTIELVGSRIIVDTQLTITQDLILQGQGAGTTVLDATGNNTRILYVDDNLPNNKIYVRINGISFTGGNPTADPVTNSGGAIWSKENLLLKDTSFYNNMTSVSGGAIFNDGGFITIDRSELHNNIAAGDGGAIYNVSGGLLIKESTIRNNTASNGAGIYSSGASAVLTVSGSTFNDNIANAAGSLGGAIYAEGKVEMDNSTLAYNTADSGSAIYMAGNGYWKYTNITVAYNTAATGTAFEVEAGNLFLINDLIINNGIGHNYSAGTANQNVYNSLISEVDQAGIFQSANLTDNGGWTKTLAIVDDSRVVDAGTNFGVPGYDQRGYGYTNTRDIGAYEYNGTIGILTYVDSVGKTQTARISSLNDGLTRTASTNGFGNLTINLFNTRILESNISANLWYTTIDPNIPRAARDIYLNGAVEGGTVISAGGAGNLFTLYGNNNGATSPAAIMGAFHLSRVTVADAVANNGPVVTGINNTTNIGSFVANEVSFVDNVAINFGGALYISSWANQLGFTITDSLFTGNIAGSSGGAVAAFKPIAITNSTVAYNRAFGVGGGIALLKDATSSGTANLNGVTVAFNDANIEGGGVFNSGGLTSALSLYAKNRSTEAPTFSGYYGYDYYVVTGTVTGTLSDQSNNLVEYQNGTWSSVAPGTSFFKVDDTVTTNPQYHDLVGAQNNIFYTGYVSDNGGFSRTVALDQFSAALDSWATSGTDQRNYDYYNYRDIGAFEFGGTYTTDTTTGKKYSSIQIALNNAGVGDTLTVKDVRIIEHDIQISKNVTLNSSNDAGSTYVRGTNTVIDAESYGRIFYIGSPSTVVTINNFYLTGGMSLIASTSGVQQAAGNGGAIYNAGTLTTSNLSVTDSLAQVTGGGIYSSKALNLSTSNAVAFIPSIFQGNSAGLYGGAIYASNVFSVKGAKISTTLAGMYDFFYNTASSGGAIYLTGVSDVGGVESISGVNFQGNSAASDGGSIYVAGGNGITIAYSNFIYNSAMNNGGMIFQTGSDLTIKDSSLSDSFAFGDGGGIYFNGGTSASMTIYATSDLTTAVFMDIFNNYSLSGSGGAIYMTTANNLNIYAQTITDGVYFEDNTVFNGDGGAIYFTNSNNINIGTSAAGSKNVYFGYNYAGNLTGNDNGYGGAIYMTNSTDLNMYQNVTFAYNNAYQSGGALFMINSGNATLSNNITFADNNAYTGHGGGMYFENVLDININYLELANNFAGGIYSGSTRMNVTSTSNGGGIYVKNSGNVALADVDAYDNIATLNGGALYIEDTVAKNLTIMSSGFDRNISGSGSTAGHGGGVYVTLASNVLLINTTFAYNTNTALWLNSVTVTAGTTLKYTTFAYDSGNSSDATPVSGIYLKGGTFAIFDSIIYENEATSTPILFNGVTVAGSSNNVFYRYDAFSATRLSSLTGEISITAYNTGGGAGGSANVLDGNSNITSYDATTNTFIQNNLYLSTEMIYHANYLTRALALESRDSLAYHYKLGGAEVRAGVNSDTTINYDQRGNMRSGITVNVDPATKAVTYVYLKYDTTSSKWQQVTVSENGSAVTTDYTGTVFTSIGAFEPNFYMTTTNNTDNNSNPDHVLHTAGTVWHDIDVALTDNATAGVTLREAIFWIDSYELGSTNNTSNFFSQDGNRYVKFANSMTNNSVPGRNVITLNANAEYLTARNDVLIGMIDNYTDGVNTYSFFEADNTFLAQNNSTQRITINANNQSRVFDFESNRDRSREVGNWYYSPKVGLNNLTMTNGRDDGTGFRKDSSDGRGGGIYNEGFLTLNNSVVENSTASNSHVDYVFHAHNFYTADGGGIYTLDTGNDSRSGNLYIIDSTITGNLADGQNTQADISNVALGGGIFQSSGLVQIVRSTIANNNAFGYGMTITQFYWNANGGGIYLDTGTMNIYSSTITGNQITTGNVGATGPYVYAHGDAIYQHGGILTLNGDTVAYNHVYKYSNNAEGEAVYLNGGSAYLENNIFANNYVVSTPDQIGRDIVAYNNIKANNNNIIGSYDTSGYNFLTGPGNIMGANETGVVTNLFLSNQLKYNGGMTQNYRLGANSVAINAGDATSVIAYDQRNLIRNGEHSIGAYELLTSVTTDSSVPDVALVNGDITFDYAYVNTLGTVHGRQGWEMNLRNALYLADQGATVTINIIPGSETFTLAAGAGALQIFNDITVNAVGATMLTVDPGNLSRAFIIDNSTFEVPSVTSTNVSLDNFRIINSTADNTLYNGNGGAIYSKGHLTLTNVSIESAVASGSGGAIYITGGNLTMNNVSINGGLTSPFAVRATGGDGGAIFIDSGSVINSANVTISGTSASGSGGAIYINNATQEFALTDSTISNTVALEGNGGAIFYTGVDMLLTNVVINGGHAQTATTAGSGGGIYAVVSGTVTLTNDLLGSTIIENCTAANLGGGIFMNSGSLAITMATVQNNAAFSHGGGIYANNSRVTLTQSSLLNNVAGSIDGGKTVNASANGGGIYAVGSLPVNINESTVGGNSASRYGGGAYINASFSSINSTYSGNTSGAYGGGIYFTNPGGSINLTYVTVANNISGTAAGATELDGGGIYVNRGTINMIDTIVAQNYSKSIADTNHNDLYLGIFGNVGNVTYSIIGITNRTASFTGQGVLLEGIDYTWGDLKLATVLDDNGGPTQTLYINSGSIAIGNGLIVAGITTDQRGIARSILVKPFGPTIGAYEKHEVVYYYVGPQNGDVNILTNWNDGSGGASPNPISFTAPDSLFVFDGTHTTPVTISTNWTVGPKAAVEIRNGGDVTVDAGFTVTAAATLVGTGFLTIDGGYSGSLTVKDASTLVLATADPNISSMVLSISGLTNSTVVYSYTGIDNQTVRTGVYGNLTLTGGNFKLASGNITVNSSLNFDNGATTTFNGGTYNITALGNVGDTGINGNITAANVILGTAGGSSTVNLNGAITATTGSVIINGSTINSGALNGHTGVTVTETGLVDLASATSSNGIVSLTSTANNVVVSGALDGQAGVTVSASGEVNLASATSSGGTVSLTSTADKVAVNGNINAVGLTVNAATMFDFQNGTASAGNIGITAPLTTLTNAFLGNADASNAVAISGNLASIGTSGINSGSLTFDSINHTVTVNANSHLTVNAGSNGITLNDTGIGGIKAQSLIVSVTGGIIEFKTTGNITSDVVTPPTQLLGTLTLTGNTITTTSARFDNTDWLIINNTQPIVLSGAIQAQNISLGNVVLAGNSPIIANNSILFNGYIDGTTANHYDLTIQAGSTISLNVVKNIGSLTATSTGGDIIIAGQVTANGDVTATSGAAGNIKLSGGIDAKGIVTMNNAVIVSGNASISGSALIFNGNINGAGNLTLSSKTAVDLSGYVLMDEGSALNLTAGSYTSTSLVGGSLTVGTNASLDFTNIALHGDLNVSGVLSGAGSLVLLDNVIARHADITLNGTYVFNDITLDNAAGASLVTGNATVLNNFAFNAGLFNIGNNVLQVLSHVTGVYGESNYFVAGSRGTLKLMVFNGAPTDFWIGSAAYASRVSIDGVAADTVFAVSTYNNVTGQGNVNGETIIGINSAVHRSWVINGVGDYNAVFGWNVAEGPGVGPVATVSNYQGWHWVTLDSSPVSSSGDMRMTSAMPLTTTGTFAVAAPGTNYDYPSSFKGLNDANANSSGFSYPSIEVDVPPSQGEYSFDMMQMYLSESVLGNPLDVFVPGTGTDIGGDYANDFMTITTGESVYGTPNGENGVNTQWTPEEEREPDPVGEELDRQLDDFFTELADNSMHEKHPAFKSEVEILLDKLLAS